LEEEAAARNSFLRLIESLGDFVFYGLQVAAIVAVVWWLAHRNIAATEDGQVSGTSAKKYSEITEPKSGAENPQRRAPDSTRQTDDEKKNQD
jgi:hypothetical protein